jgi:hypothetical protein
MGEMIGGQMITFGRPQLDEEARRIQNTSGGYFVRTQTDDLLDTWGPGELIAHKDDLNLISAIRLSKGMIWCSDQENCIFHWSLRSPNQPLLPVDISRNPQIMIGSSVTLNRQCKIERKQCWGNSVCYIEQLGPTAPYWKLDEKQLGLQAGNYVVLQANTTWRKFQGQTLKQFRLQQDDHSLVTFLDSLWGLQVSYCTGIARRVPLHEVVADLLSTFLSVYIISKEEQDIWKELRDDYRIIDTFRTRGIQNCLLKLGSRHHEAIIKMIRKILTALEHTGIDQEGKFLTVSWPQEQDIFCCFKIPCKSEHAWARVLADSGDCATFAYISSECLETEAIKCTGSAGAWRNAISLVETSITLCTPAFGQIPQNLQHKEMYFFEKFDGKFFVTVQKPHESAIAKIVVTPILSTPYNIRQRIMARFRDESNTRRRRIRERQTEEEPAEQVTIW